MAVLPDAWLLVLDALLDSPVAWRSPLEIAAALGCEPEETADLLCDLDVAGWLVVWEAEAGPLVTLSSLAVERLGVRLVEVGASRTPRWARPSEPDPPEPRPKDVCFGGRAGSLEFVADPSPSPDLTAERSERADLYTRAAQSPATKTLRPEEPPRPTILLGLSLTPWPGPSGDRDGLCPACGDMTLRPHMYCLYCDRWGLDRHEPDAPPFVADKTTVPRPLKPESERTAHEKLEAERLRSRRKKRRRFRHAARSDEDRWRKPSPQVRTDSGVALPQSPNSSRTPSPNDEPRRAPVPLYSPPVGKASAKAPR